MPSKLISVVLTVLLLVSPLTSCSDKEVDLMAVGDAYFSSLSTGDYGACYQMLSQDLPETVTLTSFVEFYTKTYELIRMKTLSWQFISAEVLDATTATLHYTLTYQCDLLEPFSQEITIPLTRTTLDWQIVWTPSLIFTDMEWDDKVLVSTIKQKRGEILDDQANVYAINEYADTVYIKRSLVNDLQDTSTRLAAILQMDAALIREIVGKKEKEVDDYAIIKTLSPGTINENLYTLLTDIPAVGIDSTHFTPVRYYPQGATFSHILGYMRPIEETYDETRYDSDSKIGASGLELAYEDQMAGYRGRDISLVDADGNKKEPSVARQEPVNGIDLTLTLDYELQLRAETLLAALPQGQSGVIVCIDPSTGDLLAASSFPDVDPNIFTTGISQEMYASLNSAEARQPLFNRITQGLYPPGSTVKPLIASMALQNKIVTPDFEFTGTIDLKKRQWMPPYPEWNAPPITRVSNYAGPVNLENAIVKSDNIYFAYLAMRAGWDRIDPFLENLGFGEAFPFSTPVARSSIRAGGSMSNLQLLASTGYGQGEMTVTPLQMAYVFSAFANHGTIMKPRLVKDFRLMAGLSYDTISSIEPAIYKENVLSSESLSILNPMLRKVITDGSGYASRLADVKTLGKTGTAEIGGNKEREIAWSISFVADADYERLVCVMLEVPTAIADAGSYRHVCVREMLAP